MVEEKRIVVLGLDYSTIPLIRDLCERGYREILVIDQSIEPGEVSGTYRSSGFTIEKVYVFFDRSVEEILRGLGAETLCVSPRVRVAKEGDIRYKASCWRRDLEPWWIPRDMSTVCLFSEGSGDFVRKKILGGCAEYTFYTPRKIDLERRVVVLRNGRVVRYRTLVSAYPLDKFIDVSVGGPVDRATREAVETLAWVGLVSVGLGIRGPGPDDQVVFHGTRASRTHMFTIVSSILRETAPPGHYLLNLQMSFCREHPPPPDIYSRAVAEARWARLLGSEEDIVLERVFTVYHMAPYGLDHSVSREIRGRMAENRVYLVGVRGEAVSMDLETQLARYRDVVREIETYA